MVATPLECLMWRPMGEGRFAARIAWGIGKAGKARVMSPPKVPSDLPWGEGGQVGNKISWYGLAARYNEIFREFRVRCEVSLV